MEPTTKLICAATALIVLAGVTIRANTSDPDVPEVTYEQTQDSPESAQQLPASMFSYTYAPGVRSQKSTVGSRSQQIFRHTDVSATPEPEEEIEEPVAVVQDEPEYVFIPDVQAGTDAQVYPDENDPVTGVWDMSDQEVLDTTLSLMTPDQRASFRATWIAMTPQERQEVIMQMRVGMGGS